ncbi:hypothetical protein ABZ904_47890 [Streptomyces sp. NPDC046900]|uniref:hypothetical protein n=1 Tax=Streptomyces sp. NPDC046900 TaxID=3155473 RepID=UPI0033F0F44D
MSPALPEFVSEVKHALTQAGFHLAEDADNRHPGLRVMPAPSGVLIKWTASDGFTALAAARSRSSGDAMKAIVQAAVSGLLVQLGHTVTESPDGAHLLVMGNSSRPSDP